jgi:hypothetical protein
MAEVSNKATGMYILDVVNNVIITALRTTVGCIPTHSEAKIITTNTMSCIHSMHMYKQNAHAHTCIHIIYCYST